MTRGLRVTVGMSLQNRNTGESRDVPLGALKAFDEDWLPICERLGLVWVPQFRSAALWRVPNELIGPIIQELCQLRLALLGVEELEWVLNRVNNALAAFAETHPAEWQYGFG
jgi:hypothetical protein